MFLIWHGVWDIETLRKFRNFESNEWVNKEGRQTNWKEVSMKNNYGTEIASGSGFFFIIASGA